MKAIENTVNWFFVVLIFVAIASLTFSLFQKAFLNTREEFSKSKGFALDTSKITEITLICRTYLYSGDPYNPKHIQETEILNKLYGYSNELNSILDSIRRNLKNGFDVGDRDVNSLINFCRYVQDINDICSERCRDKFTTCYSNMFFENKFIKNPGLWTNYNPKKIEEMFKYNVCNG